MLLAASTSLSLQRGIRRGVRHMTREGAWVLPLTVLTASVVLLHALTVLLLGVHSVNALLLSRAGVHLEALSTASDQDIQEFYAALQDLPYVERVEYVPREKALERERERDPDLVAFLEEYKLSNPFPDSFVVMLRSVDDYTQFARFIEQDTYRTVIDPSFLSGVTTQERDMRSLLEIADLLRLLSYALVFLAFVALFFVGLTIARARSRGEEAHLSTLLGAHPWVMRIPLSAQLTLLLIAALLLGTLIIGIILTLLPLLLPALSTGSFASVQSDLLSLLLTVGPLILLAEILLSPLLAYAVTMLAIRRA